MEREKSMSESRKLSKMAQHALENFSDTERASYALEDIWIEYPASSEILAELQFTLERPKGNRSLGMAIIGDSNNGKTELLKHFIDANQTKRFDDRINVRILDIDAPPIPNLGQLYSKILKRIGDSKAESGTVGLRLERLITLLKNLKVECLVIDEIHNVLAGSPVQQRAFLNMLKHLSNELKSPVIISGTEKVNNVIQSDFQVLSRYPSYRLHQWYPNEEMATFLFRLEATLPLKRESSIWKITKEIHNHAGGLVGNFVSIVRRAAYEAILSDDEIINLKLIEKCAKKIVKPNAKLSNKNRT